MPRKKNHWIAIGQDIYEQLTPELKREFADASDRYGEHYQDPIQGEMYMGDFTGDNFFGGGHCDLFDFAGLSENYGEFDLLNDVKVYIRMLDPRDFKKGVIPVTAFMKEFGDIAGVEKYFIGLANKIGKPEQLFINGRRIRI